MEDTETNTTLFREIKIDDYEKDTPDNTLLIAQSSNLKLGSGAKVWEASICLAKTLAYLQEENVYSFKGKIVLQLGCGTGLLSLFLAALGAHVIATDLPTIQHLFIKNLNNNKNVVKNKVQFRQYNWKEPLYLKQEIDYIVVSQAFISEEAMDLVLKCLQVQLQRKKSIIGFVAFKLKHHNLKQFQDKLDELQLEGIRMEQKDYNPEYYDSRTVIYVVRSVI